MQFLQQFRSSSVGWLAGEGSYAHRSLPGRFGSSSKRLVALAVGGINSKGKDESQFLGRVVSVVYVGLKG